MSLIERYADKIQGVISCYDRIVIQGILPGFCYAEGMTSYLYANKIRIFDYPRFSEPLRDAIRTNAERLASDNGIAIEFIRKSHIRKEKIIAKVLERRGTHPGLVHILSAMEACQSYKPWHNKTTGKTFLNETGLGKMSALLLLLYRQRAGALLCPGSHLVSLSSPVLF